MFPVVHTPHDGGWGFLICARVCVCVHPCVWIGTDKCRDLRLCSGFELLTFIFDPEIEMVYSGPIMSSQYIANLRCDSSGPSQLMNSSVPVSRYRVGVQTTVFTRNKRCCTLYGDYLEYVHLTTM